MKYLLLFFLFCISCYPQNAKLLNSSTNKGIPYATGIFYKDGQSFEGDYANQYGEMRMPVRYDSIVFSCIGYKTKKVDKEVMKPEIYLEEIPFELDEIFITASRNIETIGYINNKRYLWTPVAKFSQIVTFIKNPYNKQVLIYSFLFKPYKIKGRHMYRLHLYKKSDKGDFPGEDLLPQDIVRFVEKGDKGVTEIDLAGYNIVMPEGGIYAAIEGLGAYSDGKFIDDKSDEGFSVEAFQTIENIHFERPFFFKGNGWIEVNKMIIENMEKDIDSNNNKCGAPSFGLKIFKP